MSDADLILLFDQELPFSGGSHLYNHVNYLLRTDQRQRWTNTATRTCRAWIPSSPGLQPVSEFFGGPDERGALKERLLGSLKVYFQTTDLSSSGAYRSLFMARLVPVYLGPDGSPTADVWHPQDDPVFVTCIADRFAACAKADLMCMVSHVDQDERNHLHALFSWDGRKPPRPTASTSTPRRGICAAWLMASPHGSRRPPGAPIGGVSPEPPPVRDILLQTENTEG